MYMFIMYDIPLKGILSKKGKKNYRKFAKKNGICQVLGETVDGECYKIIWEEFDYSLLYHKSLIKIIK